MTETEWLASSDPVAMLGEVTAPHNSDLPSPGWRASDRKLRLFACACWRHLWAKPEELAEAAAVEAFVDGDGPLLEIPAHWVNQPSAASAASDAAQGVWSNGARLGAAFLREIVGNPFRPAAIDRRWLTPAVLSLAAAAYDERGRRCLACNKWTDCKWCNSTRRIDDGSLDGARLAVLSDALEEAGHENGECVKCRGSGKVRCCGRWMYSCAELGVECDCKDTKFCDACPGRGFVDAGSLVGHLRSPGPHVKGCWAVDLLLGKS